MDKKLNDEKNLIYLIFRSCRLCGAGGGCKMPIIATNTPLAGADVELRQKIRECVQLEVLEDDHMPPLICELCVDKINDFYEFLQMCRQTNKETRSKLGLMDDTVSMENNDKDNCILGTTSDIFTDDSKLNTKSEKPKSKPTPKKVVKTEMTVKRKSSPIPAKVKIDEPSPMTKSKVMKQEDPKKIRKSASDADQNDINSEKSRIGRSDERTNAVRRLTRQLHNIELDETRNSRKDSGVSADEESKSTFKADRSRSVAEEKPTPTPKKGILKKTVQLNVELEEMKPKLIDARKKVKISPKSPKVSKPDKCRVCAEVLQKSQIEEHMYIYHYVQFTKPSLSCDACRDWFPTAEEMGEHDKWHAEGNCYSCKRCYDDFDTYSQYLDHIPEGKCIPFYEVSDLQCDDCYQYYPTLLTLRAHECLGEDGRPADNCYRCNRKCETVRMKREHEAICNYRPRVRGCLIEPEVKSSLRDVKVVTLKCDELLKNPIKKKIHKHYYIGDVEPYFGYVNSYDYPYSSRPKRVPFKGMVDIRDEFFFDTEDYVHWDSNSDSDDDAVSNDKKQTVDTLARLCIKKLFSNQCFGKVPRKRRKIHSDIDRAESILSSMIDNDSDIPPIDADTSVSPKKSDKFNINSILNDNFDKVINNGIP